MRNWYSVIVLALLSFCFARTLRPVRADEVVRLTPETAKIQLGVSESKLNSCYENLPTALHGTVDYFTPSGLEVERGIIKSTRGGVVYDGPLKFVDEDNKDFLTNHQISAVEVYNKTKFTDNKTEFTFLFNFLRNLPDTQNGFTEKISEISLVHKINKNQTIILGQGKRLPIGLDGLPLPQYQDTALRSQTARTFSNTRAFGIRTIGDYKYMDYDIGFYDSTRYFQNFFDGSEFVYQANIKPIAKLDSKKAGSLKVGTSGQFGHAKYDYDVVGTHLAYDYKKAHAKFEYMHANGYNGNSCSNKKAGGLTSSLVYDLTPKLQLVGRYDAFDPDTKTHSNDITEYTAGLNYIVNKELKFLFNYVRQNKQSGPDSNAFYFVTRFMM